MLINKTLAAVGLAASATLAATSANALTITYPEANPAQLYVDYNTSATMWFTQQPPGDIAGTEFSYAELTIGGEDSVTHTNFAFSYDLPTVTDESEGFLNAWLISFDELADALTDIADGTMDNSYTTFASGMWTGGGVGYFSALDLAVGQYGLILEGNTNGEATISAVPIPAAALLFGSALLGFAGFSSRRKA